MVAAWMGNGRWMPRSARRVTRASETPRSADEGTAAAVVSGAAGDRVDDTVELLWRVIARTCVGAAGCDLPDPLLPRWLRRVQRGRGWPDRKVRLQARPVGPQRRPTSPTVTAGCPEVVPDVVTSHFASFAEWPVGGAGLRRSRGE